VPVLGYLGISYYPAFDVFNFSYPNVFGVEPDEAKSAQIFYWHKMGAYLMAGLIALHVAAALYHYFIRRDNVLGRMWPRFLQN
jgi:cytochrome b561